MCYHSLDSSNQNFFPEKGNTKKKKCCCLSNLRKVVKEWAKLFSSHLWLVHLHEILIIAKLDINSQHQFLLYISQILSFLSIIIELLTKRFLHKY